MFKTGFTSLVLFCALTVGAGASVPSVESKTAVLRALDKVTGRVAEIEVPIQTPYKFGTIAIKVDSCRVTPPEETPESAAFIEVSETKTGQEEVSVFKGWMFASSPALSAMEHPVYDLWLMGCKGSEMPSETQENQPKEEQPQGN